MLRPPARSHALALLADWPGAAGNIHAGSLIPPDVAALQPPLRAFPDDAHACRLAVGDPVAAFSAMGRKEGAECDV